MNSILNFLQQELFNHFDISMHEKHVPSRNNFQCMAYSHTTHKFPLKCVHDCRWYSTKASKSYTISRIDMLPNTPWMQSCDGPPDEANFNAYLTNRLFLSSSCSAGGSKANRRGRHTLRGRWTRGNNLSRGCCGRLRCCTWFWLITGAQCFCEFWKIIFTSA